MSLCGKNQIKCLQFYAAVDFISKAIRAWPHCYFDSKIGKMAIMKQSFTHH